MLLEKARRFYTGLCKKYVKWCNTTGNKLFPHHLYVAQCSCRANHLVSGSGGTAALSAPPGSSMPGLGQGCWLVELWLPLVCTTSPWWLGNTSSMALSGLSGQGGWDVSFRLLWEFLVFPKQGGFFTHWEGKASKWQAFKTLRVFMWIYKIEISLNIYV